MEYFSYNRYPDSRMSAKNPELLAPYQVSSPALDTVA